MDGAAAAGTALGGTAILLFSLLFVGYFLPSIIALLRRHKDALAIIAIDVLLGWSVAGWFIAFIWSLSDPRGRGAAQTVIINTAQHNNTGVAIVPQPAHQPPPQPTLSERDTAFWDGISNKSDPDSLEEYLHRFPNGQFSKLARGRLERAGTPAIAAPAPIVTAESSKFCEKCGTARPPESRFCESCGAVF